MPPLIAVRFYTESTPVLASRDNEPLQDLLTNITTVNTAVDGVTTSFNTLNTDYTTHHKGLGADPNGTPQVGVTHQNVTAITPGFMSPAQYTKLTLIQDNAQVNALALVEALELVSRGSTTLHRHRNADSNAPDLTPAGVYHDGFISASQAARLASVAFGAQTRDPDYTAAKNDLLFSTVAPFGADARHKHASQLSVSTPPSSSVPTVTNINLIGAGGLGVVVAPGTPGQATVTLTQAAGPAPTPTPGPTPLPSQDHSYRPEAKFVTLTAANGSPQVITPGFTPVGVVGIARDPTGYFSFGISDSASGGEIAGDLAANLWTGNFLRGAGNSLSTTNWTSTSVTLQVTGGSGSWSGGVLVLGYSTQPISFP